MWSASVFTRVMAMVLNFSIVFIIIVFTFELFFCKCANAIFAFSFDSFIKGINIFLSKLIPFTACSLKDSQNFVIMPVFCTIKRSYWRH